MPVVFFFLVAFFIFSLHLPVAGLRVAFVRTMLIMSGMVYVFTEALSAFDALNELWLNVVWGAAALLLGYWLWQKKRFVSTYRLLHHRFLLLIQTCQKQPILWGFVGVAIILGLLSVAVAPNNYDSMAYHLPRVMHWIQHQNVEYYPTAVARQLYHNPLAEYLILHIQILSGSNYLANAVQFVAWGLCLALISLIIKVLKGNITQQVVGVCWAFAIPMGLFQSTSTQNDLVAAFFLLAVVYLGLSLCQAYRLWWEQALYLSLAVGMGALTKYTMLFFALPFCVWFGMVWLQKYGFQVCFKVALMVVFFVGISLGPFMYRNVGTFHNLVGPEPHTSLNLPMANTPLNIENTVANMIRHGGNHFGLPAKTYNDWIDRGIQNVFQLLDLQWNNRNNTYLNECYHTAFGFDEDMASNPLHLLLFLVAVVYLIFTYKRLKGIATPYVFLSVCIGICFVLFSVLLRWQSMSGRLLLPLTLLACVPTALLLVGFKNIAKYLPLFALLYALPVVFLNKAKPIFVVENLARRILNQPQQQILLEQMSQLQAQVPQYKNLLESSYERVFPLHYYQLRATANTQNKEKLIALFDSLAFMQRQPVYAQSRQQQYLTNRRILQHSYQKITDILFQKQVQNIGLDLTFDAMEYPLWALTKAKVGSMAQLRYIRYNPMLAHTPNAPQEFEYEAVITEFEDLSSKYPPSAIERLYDFGDIKLIVFKTPQKQYFVEDKPPFVEWLL